MKADERRPPKGHDFADPYRCTGCGHKVTLKPCFVCANINAPKERRALAEIRQTAEEIAAAEKKARHEAYLAAKAQNERMPSPAEIDRLAAELVLIPEELKLTCRDLRSVASARKKLKEIRRTQEEAEAAAREAKRAASAARRKAAEARRAWRKADRNKKLGLA